MKTNILLSICFALSLSQLAVAAPAASQISSKVSSKTSGQAASLTPSAVPIATPAPKGSPTLHTPQKQAKLPPHKTGDFLKITPQQKLNEIHIVRRSTPVPPPEGPTYFEIFKDKGQLILAFKTKDAKLHLSRKHSILVDLMTDHPFSVSPTIITTSNWPKDSTQVVLKPGSAQPQKENRILGKAAYTYCHERTQVCTKALSTLIYFYTP